MSEEGLLCVGLGWVGLSFFFCLLAFAFDMAGSGRFGYGYGYDIVCTDRVEICCGLPFGGSGWVEYWVSRASDAEAARRCVAAFVEGGTRQV